MSDVTISPLLEVRCISRLEAGRTVLIDSLAVIG
jgi:hypothetical protein